MSPRGTVTVTSARWKQAHQAEEKAAPSRAGGISPALPFVRPGTRGPGARQALLRQGCCACRGRDYTPIFMSSASLKPRRFVEAANGTPRAARPACGCRFLPEPHQLPGQRGSCSTVVTRKTRK